MDTFEQPRPFSLNPDAIQEDDVEGDSSSASSMSSTGTMVPTSTGQTRGPEASWYDYFEREMFLKSRDATYHIYITPPKIPTKDPLFVCHHGAGSSGLTFALFAAELLARMPSAGVMSVDARGHGFTTHHELEVDSHAYSLAALSDDLVDMIRTTQAELSWAELPNMLLVGHSLGGAVVTDVAKRGILGSKLVGFAVIDVVEGSAMDALKSMKTYLGTRPLSFESEQAAIDWHTRSRTLHNPESAKISVPSLLVRNSSALLVWRTELEKTIAYWENWFTGMSDSFLAGKAAKLLILAGTDRLDKSLMIGQMQGKFQLEVFPEAGHFVQEDLPAITATTVADFYKRNDRSNLVLPPKVSDLLKQGNKV